jgi:hypothetical protein
MDGAERRGNKVVATASRSTRRSRRYYTIRTGKKTTNNPGGVRKIAQARTKGKESGRTWQKQQNRTTPKVMEENQTHQ